MFGALEFPFDEDCKAGDHKKEQTYNESMRHKLSLVPTLRKHKLTSVYPRMRSALRGW
jgi:hypothetical protein